VGYASGQQAQGFHPFRPLQALFPFPLPFIRLLVFGDIPHNSQDMPAVFKPNGGKGQFDGEFSTVFSAGLQLDGSTGGFALTGFGEWGKGGAVLFQVTFGGKHLMQIPSHCLIPCVTENMLGRRVPE
jgi:hypothetical protein